MVKETVRYNALRRWVQTYRFELDCHDLNFVQVSLLTHSLNSGYLKINF
ncbi:MAG: hypothetical protein IJV35_00860 [Neisseriaceae bacterium]|nr:hypothetical protein [Neisseriaceae bacterium]